MHSTTINARHLQVGDELGAFPGWTRRVTSVTPNAWGHVHLVVAETDPEGRAFTARPVLGAHEHVRVVNR